ncbi:hypothetical protein VKT23_017033 [Stygiomarasmius scandens]|uniref:Uncharacterized protein n=1 Tax=Marasmiellus scandens TaxID=2682957 RepID=A0ABR1IT52_9AGAR
MPPYTDSEIDLLVHFIAREYPRATGKYPSAVFKKFVLEYGTAHSERAWTTYYRRRRGELNRRILERTRANNIWNSSNLERSKLDHVSSPATSCLPSQVGNPTFTKEEDEELIKFLAVSNSSGEFRSFKVYRTFVENRDGVYKFAQRHSAKGWNDRVRRNIKWFRYEVRRYQDRHGMKVTVKPSLQEPPLPPRILQERKTPMTQTTETKKTVNSADSQSRIVIDIDDIVTDDDDDIPSEPKSIARRPPSRQKTASSSNAPSVDTGMVTRAAAVRAADQPQASNSCSCTCHASHTQDLAITSHSSGSAHSRSQGSPSLQTSGACGITSKSAVECTSLSANVGVGFGSGWSLGVSGLLELASARHDSPTEC